MQILISWWCGWKHPALNCCCIYSWGNLTNLYRHLGVYEACNSIIVGVNEEKDQSSEGSGSCSWHFKWSENMKLWSFQFKMTLLLHAKVPRKDLNLKKRTNFCLCACVTSFFKRINSGCSCFCFEQSSLRPFYLFAHSCFLHCRPKPLLTFQEWALTKDSCF